MALTGRERGNWELLWVDEVSVVQVEDGIAGPDQARLAGRSRSDADVANGPLDRELLAGIKGEHVDLQVGHEVGLRGRGRGKGERHRNRCAGEGAGQGDKIGAGGCAVELERDRAGGGRAGGDGVLGVVEEIGRNGTSAGGESDGDLVALGGIAEEIKAIEFGIAAGLEADLGRGTARNSAEIRE